MSKTPSALLSVLVALWSPALMAQTADAPAAGDPVTDAVEDATATTDGLSMGQQVQDGNQIGATYTAASFEAWEQRCVRTESGIDPCQLYILLRDDKDNAVGEFTMFSLPEGAPGPAVAGANFIAPLETLLPAGMTLQIDSEAAKVYPFTFCTEVGCVSRLGFTADEVAAMKKGAQATITIVPFVAPDQKVVLPVSLKGFTAGMAAVDAANEASYAAIRAAREAAPGAPAAPAADAPAPAAPAAEAPAANE